MLLWTFVALFAAYQAAPECKNCGMVGKDEKAMFRAHSDACLAQSGVQPRLVESLLRGEQVDDPALRRHVYCVLLHCKLIGKDGKIQKTARLGKMAWNATKVMEGCASQAGERPEDLAWNLFRCGYDRRALLLHRMPTPSAGHDDNVD